MENRSIAEIPDKHELVIASTLNVTIYIQNMSDPESPDLGMESKYPTMNHPLW